MEAGGFDIAFGEGGRVPGLLHAIAERRGRGDLLAEGARRVGSAIGRPDAAMHVKGLELPGYDPRALQAMAVGLAVGTRGADHNRSGAYELDFSTRIDRGALKLDDVPLIVEIESQAAVLDSLVLCKFLRGAFDDPEREWGEMLYEVTGVRIDTRGLGARVCVLRRLFNQRAGWRPEDDRLPRRLLTGGLEERGLEQRIARYYRERGCNEQGFVTRETLRAHGLEALWDEARDAGGARSDPAQRALAAGAAAVSEPDLPEPICEEVGA
jgi:aldehyde:ferredoxin oxidoreductase